MRAGLTNLDGLKKQLLAGSLVEDTQFDTKLAAIGLAVAGLFESFCNRKFQYSAAAEMIVTGDRDHVVVDRYPIISVTSVSTRWDSADAWEVQTGEPVLITPESGVIRFGSQLGNDRSQVKVVYVGGYFFETLEPSDGAYPTALPTGAYLLPDDLRGAFFLQCEQAWQTHDKLGTGIVGGDGGQFLNTRLSTLELLPIVKTILQSHIRYQLS